MTSELLNKCQYWSLYEPPQCAYWNDDQKVCDYKTNVASEDLPPDPIITPKLAPYCNLVGTGLGCDKYSGPEGADTYYPRCILPDQFRHVCNRETGKKWVTASGTVSGTSSDGYDLYLWDFGDINGYNDGKCDGYGTDTTCSGYGAQHLGFGELQPSSSQFDDFENSKYKTSAELGYRLPTNYVVYNIRAKISKCHWWDAAPGLFGVTASGVVEAPFLWSCTHPDDTSKHSEFNLENGPPCNGCKPECSKYTGVCWEYCIDERMQVGDPILAEQIHELRYYHRENKWTMDAIEAMFVDEGMIFTWQGTETDVSVEEVDEFGEETATPVSRSIRGDISTKYDLSTGIPIDYEIPSIKVFMDQFDYFETKNENLVLTKGTTVTKQLEDWPNLIRPIQELPLSPIIKNRFNQHPTDPKNIFEVPYLKREANITICGKIFYDLPTYAINISDRELYSILPNELIFFDNIYDIETTLGEKNYEIFKEELEKTLEVIQKIHPDKIFSNKLSDDDGVFLIDVDVLSMVDTYDSTNKNTILVYQETSDYFVYDKIEFTKVIPGGMIFQKDFSVNGLGDFTRKPIPDYESSFMIEYNNNGEMSFEYSPFVSEDITTQMERVYNDSRIREPDVGLRPGRTIVGSRLYEIDINAYILESINTEDTEKEYYVLGSNGMVLVYLKNDNSEINSVIKKWEADKIYINFEEEVIGDDGTPTINIVECEMEVETHGADGLLPHNQVILKPKDISKFKSLCNDNTIIFENLKYWEKYSFGETPTKSFGDVKDISEEGTEFPVDKGQIMRSGNELKLTKFNFSLVPAVVMMDSLGRPICQTKTKPIGMVKQPGCPETELDYTWRANYQSYDNIPNCLCCCGPWHEKPSKSWNSDGRSVKSNKPICIDHKYSPQQVAGPMCWPFNSCQAFASYVDVTNLDNWDIRVIGLFKAKDEDENYINGQHNMRMLCPRKRYGRQGLGCPWWSCSCYFTTHNTYMQGDPWFAGWGKIRSGVDDGTISLWVACGSPTTVQFGNDKRSVLRHYLTTDQLPFIRLDWGENGQLIPVLDWMLMPTNSMFSESDITSNFDEMWDYNCSRTSIGGEEVYGSNVVNPLGFYLAKSYDGVSINENFDFTGRFRFEDVMRGNTSFNLAYPRGVGKYLIVLGDKILNRWHEFKEYPLGEGFVQWAWREPWQRLERVYNLKEGGKDSSGTDYLTTLKDTLNEGNMKGNFIEDTKDGGLITGRFPFSVDYPKYKFDWELKEYRLMPSEGETIFDLEKVNASLKFIAPEKDEYTGDYIGYPALQLNSGPKRAFTWEGVWLDDDEDLSAVLKAEHDARDEDDTSESPYEEYNVELYQECVYDSSKVERVPSGNPNAEMESIFWSGEVTLFDTNNDSIEKGVAEDEDRLIINWEPGAGGIVNITKEYFHRGLKIDLVPEVLGKLPLSLSWIDQFEFIGEFYDQVSGVWDSFSVGQYFDNIKHTVGRVSYTFKWGTDLIDVDPDTGEKNYQFYHEPQIFIYSSNDGVTPETLLYSSDGMTLYTDEYTDYHEVKTEVVEWQNTIDYIGNGKKGLVVVFRITPTEDEYQKASEKSGIPNRYGPFLNLVSVTGYESYSEKLTNGYEGLNIRERRYYVSYGGSGVHPPQGKDGEQLFDSISGDWSTYWQYDTDDGVKGLPNSSGAKTFMNKVRGRQVDKVFKDEQKLQSGLAEMENYQKQLYDWAVDKLVTDSEMKGIIPVPLQKLLSDNGVNFYGPGNLYLKNSLPSKLAEINQFKELIPEGHRYEPSNPWNESCGRCSNCMKGDRFVYKYTCKDKYTEGSIFDASHSMPDILDQYSMGGIWIMERRDFAEKAVGYIFASKWDRSTSSSIYKDPPPDKTLMFPSFEDRIRHTPGGYDPSSGGTTINTMYMDNWNRLWASAFSIYGMAMR